MSRALTEAAALLLVPRLNHFSRPAWNMPNLPLGHLDGVALAVNVGAFLRLARRMVCVVFGQALDDFGWHPKACLSVCCPVSVRFGFLKCYKCSFVICVWPVNAA